MSLKDSELGSFINFQSVPSNNLFSSYKSGTWYFVPTLTDLLNISIAVKLFISIKWSAAIWYSRYKSSISIFKLSFADHQDYAHELTALGQHYSLYEGMMNKWKEMYPQRILDVRYEDTVSDIQEQCVRLVGFLGLDFEPEMLEFYSNKRLVRTPSASQVRKPIYKSSVQAWKKYEQHLQPLVEALRSTHVITGE